MNEQAQRIAIATFCGWQAIELRDSINSGKKDWLCGLNPNPDEIVKVIDAESGEERAPNESDYGYETLPDFLHNLNAIHEAEKHLIEAATPLQRSSWFIWLQANGNMSGILSTASQRTEAILRTIGEWRD